MSLINTITSLTSQWNPPVFQMPVANDHLLSCSFEFGRIDEQLGRQTGILLTSDQPIRLISPLAGGLSLIKVVLGDHILVRLQLSFLPLDSLGFKSTIPTAPGSPVNMIWRFVDENEVALALTRLLQVRLSAEEAAHMTTSFLEGREIIRVAPGDELGLSAANHLLLEFSDDAGRRYHPLFLFERWRAHDVDLSPQNHMIMNQFAQDAGESLQLEQSRVQFTANPETDLGPFTLH